MNYRDIPKVCKRYSFESKIKTLSQISFNLFRFKKNSIVIVPDLPHPWELETLLMFCMDDEWYGKNDFCKNGYPFYNLINAIRDFEDEKIFEKGKEDLWLRNIGIVCTANQFDIQKVIKFKYYRYNYIFSYVDEEINMPLIFEKKFKVDYRSFMIFANCLFMVANADKLPNKYKFMNNLCVQYNNVVSSLTLSKDKFEEEIKKFSNNYEDCRNCVKVCNSYPFINYKGKIYFTFLHSLLLATTKSLFLRLTDKDNKLKSLMGKTVIESYLYTIITESGEFDEVLKEQEYGRNKKKTPDLMCRRGNQYLFFECKSSTPFARTRCLDESSIQEEISRIIDNMKQLYKQIRLQFLQKKYYCFTEKTDIHEENCYGIVCFLEESNISRQELYERFAENMKISTESNEYKWIINHIKLCPFYSVEMYAFTKNKILDALIEQKNTNMPYDFPLSNYQFNNHTILNQSVLDLNKGIIKECSKILKLWYIKS